MKKVIAIGLIIAGICTYFFGCGNVLPHNLANADDEDLCLVLRVCIDEKKIPDYDNPTDEDLSKLSEEEKSFYILSVFDMLFQCGGLGGYIINTDGVYLDEIEPLLRQFELYEMADVYRSYFETHDIVVEEFKDLDADLEKLDDKYELDAFDDAFYACYEETDLTKVLADYARGTFLDEYQKWI